MAGSYTSRMVLGQDPIRNVSPEARHVSPEVAESFIVPEWAKRSYQRKEVLKQFVKDPRRGLYDNYIEQFKLHNKSVMQGVRAGMPDMAMQNAMRGLERVEIDEGDEQQMLNMLWEIQSQVQEIDPSFSVNDDPYYAKMARSLGMNSPEFAPTTPSEAGDTTAAGRTARAVGYGLTEGVTEVFGQVSDGFVELGFLMLGGLDSNYYEAWRNTKAPTKFLLDKDGSIVNNGGKIGRMESPYLTFQLMTGLAIGDIEREANKFRETVEWDKSQVQKGAETYANAIASVAGGLATFMATGGGALLASSTKLLGKGAGVLLASSAPRVQKIGRVLTEVGGLSLGTAVWEMGMYGNAEGYGKAFMEGMKMGPVFWVAGKLGKGLDGALATRKKMPKRVRDFMVGALEGVTISASELTDMTSSLWRFMRDPDNPDAQAEWAQSIVGNLIGMGLYKASTGHTPFEESMLRKALGEQGMQGALAQEKAGGERRKAASKAKDTVDMGKASQRFGARGETFQTYTEKVQEFERTTSQGQREISGELAELESKMDVEVAGKDLTKAERLEANLEIRRATELEGSDPLEDPMIRDKLTPEQFKEMASKTGARARRHKMEDFLGRVDRRGTKGEVVPGYKIDPTDPTRSVKLTKREGDRRRADKDAKGEEEFYESDPMEDPSILEKLSPEEFQDVISGKTSAQRRRLLEKYLGKADRRGVKGEILPEYRIDPATNKVRVIRAGGERRVGGERRGSASSDPEILSLETEQVPGPRGGQPKSLRLQPEHQVEEVEGTPDIRKKDILSIMEGIGDVPVKVPIRKGVAIRGKLSTKGLMGWYEQQGQQIRLKGARDIVVGAHEWSHAFETAAIKAGQWQQSMADPWLADLAKVAETYPGYAKLPKRSRIAEGWAEFWAREMLGDPILQQEVPEFHDFMMKLISKPGMAAFRAQHDEIALELQNYINLGSVRRVRMSWIGASEQPSAIEQRVAPTTFQRFKSAFSKYMLDDVAPLKEAEAKWLEQAGVKLETLPMALSPTKLIDAFRMTATNQAQRLLNEGTFDVTGRRTGEGLKGITNEIGPERMEDFTTYMVARRAIDQVQRSHQLVAQGKISAPFEMPFAHADALEAVRVLETPDFMKAADRIRQWANRILDYAVEAGSISASERDAMIESNPIYLPFQRVLEGAARVKSGRGIAEKGSGIGRLRGAQEEIRDPWEAMHDVTLGIVTKAQQTMVMRAMYLQGKVIPGVAGFVTEVPLGKRPQKIMLERLQEELARQGKKRGVPADARKALEKMIELVAGGSEDAALTFFFQQTTPTGSRPIIAFKPNFTPEFVADLPITDLQKGDLLARSGKLIWLEVDSEAYSVLMGIDAPRLFLDDAPEMLRNMIMLPTRMVRFGATQANPEFIIRNMIRDPMSRQLFTKEGGNRGGPLSGFAAMFKGAADRLKGTEGVELFENMGLSGATMFGTEMGRELAGSTHGLVKGIRAAGDFLNAPEKWLRTKEFTDTYDRLKAEGAPEFEAIMQATLAAKEVTVNFTRAGILARQMNQFLPYFSPQIAGKRKFWRAVTGAEGDAMQRQAIIRGMVNLGGMSAAVWFFFGDEDWYQDLPEWRRINHWNFKIADQIVSIPKPFEPGILFGTGTELALQALSEHDPALARETALSFFGDMLVGYPWIPSGVLPIAEGASDYSFFREQSILPRYMSDTKIPADQYTSYTSEMFKFVGRQFNVSPAKLEYIFDSYTGGILRQAARLGESIAGLRDAEPTLSKLPFFGTLFRQEEHKQGRAVDELYEAQKTMRQLSGSGKLDLSGKHLQSKVNAALGRIRDLRKSGLSANEIARRAFRIADPVVTETRKKL